ncbi:spondin domain-containing protein [Chitinophaga rhizosphaerae]|uniref:spondin domain-containing protein n=1 Tax=Chitinophaga rhizosphaerae TaxID=1864947 RepID=UPI000F80C164|nr:spondin domain-containing protein [Chitinophaga rhizosphaerae]
MEKTGKSVLLLATSVSLLAACHKDDDMPMMKEKTVMVENVLQAKNLVESGAFVGPGKPGTPPVVFPGQEVAFSFSAGKGQAVSFATMYGWSNDLFFAPANPGIALYDAMGKPLEGDVSGQLRLWDNGSRVNQSPGASVTHPGTPESKPVAEVGAADAQGNTYLPASSLMKCMLKYDGNSRFTLTIRNVSGGTANETPFSPGVWAVSNILGGNLLNGMPLYESGKPSANGLTPLAESGNNQMLAEYAAMQTGILTPLSPILIVVYRGNENPLFMVGEKDRGKGLADLAQKGDASKLESSLKLVAGVRHVYVAKAANTGVLLPVLGQSAGGSISQRISFEPGDRVTFATMFGYSNDWFYSFGADGIMAGVAGNQTDKVTLYDNGTAVDQYPGAGNSQGAFGGAPQTPESLPITEVSGEMYPVPAPGAVLRFTITN